MKRTEVCQEHGNKRPHIRVGQLIDNETAMASFDNETDTLQRQKMCGQCRMRNTEPRAQFSQ